MQPVSPAVLAVCRARHADADLVLHHIYAFLDVSARWTLATAAAAGHLHLVRRLSRRTPHDAPNATHAMDLAAKYGHLDVLQWLHRHREEGCSAMALVDASYAGHAHVVQWLLVFRREGRISDAIAGTATGGHEELLSWLLSHTYLRDPQTPLAPKMLVAPTATTKQPPLALNSAAHCWVTMVEHAFKC